MGVRRLFTKRPMVRARGDGPGMVAWTVASVSLVLPFAGGALVVLGGAGMLHGQPEGWQVVLAGLMLLALDLAIDFVWAHPLVSASDQPDLNRKGDQLTGRIVTVADAIEGGRGKVRVADTLWIAEGPDIPAGEPARVIAAQGAVLHVEAVASAGDRPA